MKTWKHFIFAAILANFGIIVGFIACADSEKDFITELIDEGESVVISRYVGSKKEVRIPSRIRKLPVTHIGEWAFGRKGLAGVTIPKSVTSIGDNAFARNWLFSVTIPDSVTSIGDYAFAGNNLTSITIPDSVTSLGCNVFSGNNMTRVTFEGNEINLKSNVFFGNLADVYSEEESERAGTYIRDKIGNTMWTKELKHSNIFSRILDTVRGNFVKLIGRIKE